MAIPYDQEKFIEILSNNRFLFDKKERNFKNRHLKDETWKEIGNTFGLSGDKISKKFKSMRDYYAKIKKTMELNSQKSDSGTGAIIDERNWIYFNLLDNLLNDSENVVTNGLVENEIQSSPTEPILENFMSSSNNLSSCDIILMETCLESPKAINKSATQNTSKRKTVKTADASTMCNFLKQAKETVCINSQTNNTEDDITHFAKFIEFNLRKLPEKRRKMLIKHFTIAVMDD